MYAKIRYVVFGTTKVQIVFELPNILVTFFYSSVVSSFTSVDQPVLFYSFAIRQCDELACDSVAHLAQVADAARQAETTIEVKGLYSRNRSTHL